MTVELSVAITMKFGRFEIGFIFLSDAEDECGIGGL